MTENTLQKHGYMTGLDGLRALAVFAVIGFHLGLSFMPGGFLGVTLFFVLSGYLITDILSSEWSRTQTISFKNFFIRRGKRLLPSVYFLLICVTAYVTVFRPELATNLKSSLLPAAFFFSNWWYIFQQIPYFASFGTPSLLNHFWSLAVEVQFYFLWPFLLFLGHKFIKKKWLLIAITAALATLSAVLMGALYQPGTDPSRIYYGTDTRVFSLLIGACLALLCPSAKLTQPVQKKAARITVDAAGFIALLGIVLSAYFITQYDDFLYRGGMFLFSIASAALIVAVAIPSTVIGKVFSIKPLRFIGNISYGVYLWQFPVIVLTNTLVQSSSVSVVLSIVQVAATILLATASYYFIEMPIRKKKILESLRSTTVRDYWPKFLQTGWLKKTTALTVTALVLVSGIGLLTAKSAPSSSDGELAALPSELMIGTSQDTGASSDPLSVQPASEVTSSVSQSDVPVFSAQNPEPPVSDAPMDEASSMVSPADSPAIATPSPDISSSSGSQSTSQDAPAQGADSPPAGPDGSSDPSPDSSAAVIPQSSMSVTMIGDSVGIDVAPYLKKYYPNLTVDAKVGRQFYELKKVVQQLIDNNTLAPTVVIELGSNGTVSESQMRAVIDLIGTDRNIVFVNSQVPRSWCAGVNSTLSKITAEYANTIVADWYSASIDKSNYFYNDGVHPNKNGCPVLAKVIYDTISML